MKYIMLIAVLAVSAFSHADEQFNTGSYGKINYVRSYGDLNSLMPTFIQVEGATVRSTCAHQNFGVGDLNYFLVKPEEKHLLSIVLAAAMAGKEVKITSNDTPALMHNESVCRVLYIDVKI